MNRSKKIFIFIAIVFLIILAVIVWDFSRKTEFRKFESPQEQDQRVEKTSS